MWGDVDVGRDTAGESEPGVPRLNDAWLTNAADGYICSFTEPHGAEQIRIRSRRGGNRGGDAGGKAIEGCAQGRCSC